MRFLMPFFEDGSKSLEIRTAVWRFPSIEAGDILCFNNSVRRRVVAVRRYPDLEVMMGNEDFKRIHPNWTKERILDELTRTFRGRSQGKILVFELATP